MIIFTKPPYICQGLWEKMSYEEKFDECILNDGAKVDMIKNPKVEVSLRDLQYWLYQLNHNKSNERNILNHMQKVYDKGMQNAEVKGAVEILLNIDPECMEWIKHTEKETVKKLIEKLEVGLNS